jgi:hypothetical protein
MTARSITSLASRIKAERRTWNHFERFELTRKICFERATAFPLPFMLLSAPLPLLRVVVFSQIFGHLLQQFLPKRLLGRLD